MDAIKRGAMLKMGRLALGGLGAAASLGKSGNAYAPSNIAPPSSYPSDYAKTQNAAGQPIGDDPVYSAKREATRPLREKIEELYGERGHQLRRYFYAADEDSYLPALRSTQRWWRASVAMDRARKRETAIQTLQAQIQSIMQSPLDGVQNLAKEALAAFMTEFNKS